VIGLVTDPVHITTVGPYKYGDEWMAEVTLADGRNLSDTLVGLGLAVLWDGTGPRPTTDSELSTAAPCPPSSPRTSTSCSARRDRRRRASTAARTPEAVARHGKQTQAEIHRALPNISNPPGLSQHELRSDGVANPRVPRGGKLKAWQVGVDSGTNDEAAQARITQAARRLGWHVRHPYSRGVEGHHWCLATKPRPKGLKQRAKIIRLRATLPRR
jgi:hypothetical protein